MISLLNESHLTCYVFYMLFVEYSIIIYSKLNTSLLFFKCTNPNLNYYSALNGLFTYICSFESYHLRFFIVVLHENPFAYPFSLAVLHQMQTYILLNKEVNIKRRYQTNPSFLSLPEAHPECYRPSMK